MASEEKVAKTKTDATCNTPGPAARQRAIEHCVEEIFREFEGKAGAAGRGPVVIGDSKDVKVEIARRDGRKRQAVKGNRKPASEKKRTSKFRPVYAVCAGLVTAAAGGFVLLIMAPAPAPQKPAAGPTVYKIVQPAPEPAARSSEENIAPVLAPSPEVKRQEPVAPAASTTDLSEEIRTFLTRWKTGWENSAGKQGDMEAFMSLFADGFTSQGMNKAEWRKDKTLKNRAKEWIRLGIKNVRISAPVIDDRAEVHFLLSYSSSNYLDEGNLILILKKEADSWKILEQKSVSE